jgi:tocopherol cyclase
MMALNKLSSFFHPERFQGWGKSKNYFEGWYCKVVNRDASKAFAFIPGIAIDPAGNAHAFVQVLDGKAMTAKYHRFEFQDFHPSSDRFQVKLAHNSFSNEGLELNLEGVRGQLQFSGNVPWPSPFYAPGIMGPFSFVPFMECYHGIVSMDHAIQGWLEVNGEHINMDGGRGYMEKDWGRSFPSAYVWMQCNHFKEDGISVKSSVAKIPWLGSSFTGFISGFWLQGELFRFTTYNQTRLKKFNVGLDQVDLVMENKKYRIEWTVRRDHATALASPILGLMEGRIEESMSSSIQLQLTEIRAKKIIYEGQSSTVAIEVAGDIPSIIVP